MITSKQAARLRDKKRAGKNLTPANERKLADYEAMRARAKSGDPAPGDQPPGDQPPGEPAPAGGEPAPAQDAKPAAPPPPIPDLEPPPAVKDPPRATATTGGDWRDTYRKQIHFQGDGRQMLCEQIGMSIVEGLSALRSETAKVTTPKTPDPKLLAGMFILAIDDLLPERARMTPRIGAAVITGGTIVERFYHSKAILEVLKNDPEHIEWLRQQKQREHDEQAARAAHDAEVAAAAASVAQPEQPKYAEPAQQEAPPPTNGVKRSSRARAQPIEVDHEPLC